LGDGRDWQCIALVLDEDERLSGSLAGDRANGGLVGKRWQRGVGGPVEQADRELDAQDAPYRLVDRRRREPLGVHLACQVAGVMLADHVHVDAGLQRAARGLDRVAGDAVIDQVADRVEIRRHVAVEAEPPAQNAGQ
jgi:hypothetical protein